MDSYRMSRPPEGYPRDCVACLEPVGYWQDPEGVWAECACDGGYLR